MKVFLDTNILVYALTADPKRHRAQEALAAGYDIAIRAGGSVSAGGLFAGLLGMAGAAHADLSDVIWNQQQQQRVYVPHVDTTVHHSR